MLCASERLCVYVCFFLLSFDYIDSVAILIAGFTQTHTHTHMWVYTSAHTEIYQYTRIPTHCAAALLVRSLSFFSLKGFFNFDISPEMYLYPSMYNGTHDTRVCIYSICIILKCQTNLVLDAKECECMAGWYECCVWAVCMYLSVDKMRAPVKCING